MRSVIIGSALACALTACATPYTGGMGLMGGVAAYPVMTDVYRIEARGNGYTNAARVQDFVLLKAAETTLAAGKTHFGLTSAADASRQGAIETPGTMQATRVGNTITGIYTPGSVSTF